MPDTTPLWRRFCFYLNVAGLRLATVPFAQSIAGTDRLPPEPYIVAANHRSLLDGPLLVNEFNRIRRRAMHMIAFQEPFSHPFYGLVLKASGCIPFDRGDPASRVHVLRVALGFLAAGEPVGVFPEAHLSRTAVMRRGRPGVALLALESGCPVVPVGLRGTERVLEPGTGRFRPRRAGRLEVGFPLDFSARRAQFQEGTPEERAATVAAVTDEVMLAIAALSGQSYPHAGKPFGTRRQRRRRDR